MKALSIFIFILSAIFSLPSSAVTFDPDLAISPGSLIAPASANAGETISASYGVVNLGGDTLVNAWKDSVYLSADSNFDVTDLLLADISKFGTLSAGESYTRSLVVQIPLATSAGAYYLLVGTDTGSQVFESNETNNFSGAEIEVLAAVIPLPAAVWLFGTALIGLLGLSKRRKVG